MAKNNSSSVINMVDGPLFSRIVSFAVPVMLTGLLTLLFNAVDIVVVGQFAGEEAMGAVGATVSLINIFITLFIGISLAGNVMVARYYAMKDKEKVFGTVHTLILFAFICGIIMIFVGIIISRPILELMDTPAEIIDKSVLYFRIYFVGMPFFMVYNFGSSILKAIGNSKKPLYYLAFAGVCNVFINLLMVIVFHMDVAGVAIGTVVSQLISAALVVRFLVKSDGMYKLYLSKLHINKWMLKQVLKIGIPAGLQSMLINVSNVLIQSTVNSYGTIAVAGNTAGNSLNGFLYMAINGVTQTALSFTSQNFGVRKFDRIKKIVLECAGIQVVLGTAGGLLMYTFGRQLLGIYTNSPEVMDFGMINLAYICIPYALCGIMDLLPGCTRGLGVSIPPMIISLAGVVGFRFLWIFAIYPNIPSFGNIFLSFPISWVLTGAVQVICYIVVYRKMNKKFGFKAKNI